MAQRYYPVEFMAAVLSNGKGFYHPILYVLECHRLGIRLLPPSISRPDVSTRRKSYRVPVRYVKGLTARTNEWILAEHDREPFSSPADFYRQTAPSPQEMELLLRAGAFDEFGGPRTSQFWECQFLQAHSAQLAEDCRVFYLLLRGPPFGQPTFLVIAASLAALLDLPL